MASKPYNSPLIILKGFNNLSELLSNFPFDIVYKHMIVNNIKIFINRPVPSIPDMIEFIWNVLYTNRLKEKYFIGDYAYEEFGGFRLTVSNKQFELSYKIE